MSLSAAYCQFCSTCWRFSASSACMCALFLSQRRQHDCIQAWALWEGLWLWFSNFTICRNIVWETSSLARFPCWFGCSKFVMSLIQTLTNTDNTVYWLLPVVEHSQCQILKFSNLQAIIYLPVPACCHLTFILLTKSSAVSMANTCCRAIKQQLL